MTSAPISEGAEVRLLARWKGKAVAWVSLSCATRGKSKRMGLAKMDKKAYGSQGELRYPLAWQAGSLPRGAFLVLCLGGLPIAEAWMVALHTQIGGHSTPMRDAGLFGGRSGRWRGLAAQCLQQQIERPTQKHASPPSPRKDQDRQATAQPDHGTANATSNAGVPHVEACPSEGHFNAKLEASSSSSSSPIYLSACPAGTSEPSIKCETSKRARETKHLQSSSSVAAALPPCIWRNWLTVAESTACQISSHHMVLDLQANCTVTAEQLQPKKNASCQRPRIRRALLGAGVGCATPAGIEGFESADSRGTRASWKSTPTTQRNAQRLVEAAVLKTMDIDMRSAMYTDATTLDTASAKPKDEAPNRYNQTFPANPPCHLSTSM
ncbi:hypothetical protein PMIN01_04372 [Paraphaeosphaeria minitans]|uniref:Uncharacterized protein n=1 Tax=Paraphaeosphaeria minitans TaxID=565426 RepID=A0A9P6GJK9_9PLEO|nr:hypothetical protein PMIN01_04372 [Paraphaeosphaeria minitans]